MVKFLERCVYRIDRDDLIVFVDSAWDRFAIRNEAPELESKKVIGRKLWDLVDDEVTRHVYQQMLAEVRNGRSISFDFRCDSPNRRRFLEMKITPFADRGVQFETVTKLVEERSSQDLYRRSPRFTGGMVVTCSWCKKVKTSENVWHEVEQAVQMLKLFDLSPAPQISHGMCEICYGEITAKLV